MDAKKLLLETFDKIALGVAGVLLVAFVAVSFLAEAPEAKAKEQVLDYNRKIKHLTKLAEASPPKSEPLSHAKDVDSALKGGPAPEELPEWLFHKRPLTAARVKAEQQNEPVHLPPMELKADARLGAIAVSWQDNTKSQYVKIDAYKVFRAVGEPKDFQEAAALDGAAHAWVDRDVKTKTSYYYYVESSASLDKKHPMVTKGKVAELDPGQVKQKSEVAGPIQTQRDTVVEVVGATPKSTPAQIAGGDDHPASAFLKVWRWFDAEKTWLSSNPVEYKLGEKDAKGQPKRIGGLEGFGEKKRDFTTDYVLDNVVTKEVTREIGGQKTTQTVSVVVLKDAKSGEKVEISVEEPDPALPGIKKNPKGEGDDAGGEGAGGGDKGKGEKGK